MYQWWVFVHLVGVFGFLVSHGVSVAITFRLRTERNPERINALLQLSGSSIKAFYGSLFLLLLGGVVAGFIGDWWAYVWIWAAIVILVVTSLAMYGMARPFYRKVGLVAKALAGGSEAVTDEQFDQILRSRRPISIAAIGGIALVAILYLMVFKPTLTLGGTKPSPAPAACSPSGTALSISASTLSFDKDCLAAPAARGFTLEFDNTVAGIPHNVSIYTDSSAADSLFVGERVDGPKSVTYRVGPLPAGTYYFRCDFHPPQMNGTFVVK
jgi:plastocyanin